MSRRHPRTRHHRHGERELGLADADRRFGSQATHLPNGGSSRQVEESDRGEHQHDDDERPTADAAET